jgi:hypothetical protein
MSTTKKHVTTFNNQVQQEKSKLNETLQNLDKFETISKSLLDVSGENDYVKDLDKFFYNNTEINVVQLFLSNRYQAVFMFALKFFIEIYKVNDFPTRNHYFKHLKDEMVGYLKSQNKEDQFIQESCLWLEFQIKHFQNVVLGYRHNVSSLPLLDNLESYFQKS